MKSQVTSIDYDTFKWIDYTHPGLSDLDDVAKRFGFHPYLLHDSIEHGHLPKIEHLEDYTFAILRAYSARRGDLINNVGDLSNKIAFFIKDNLLITVHRGKFSFLSELNSQYKHIDQLVIDIVKQMVLTYDEPLSYQGDKMDELEQLIFLKNGDTISIKDLYYQKTEARLCKKLLLMTQSVISQLKISPDYATRMQDVKDTLIHTILLYDEVNDDANNLMNIYLSVTAQKSNEVMKILTVFSAFFLPLTFVVGIYGMNFEFMPELSQPYGYFAVLIGMAVISILIFIWFRRKKFL